MKVRVKVMKKRMQIFLKILFLDNFLKKKKRDEEDKKEKKRKEKKIKIKIRKEIKTQKKIKELLLKKII